MASLTVSWEGGRYGDGRQRALEAHFDRPQPCLIKFPTRFGRQKSSKHRSCRSSFQACLGDRLACARSSAALAATPDYSHGLLLDHSITLVFFIIVIVEASAIAVTKRSELSRPRRLRWRWAAACVWRALFGRLRWTRDALVSPTHTSVMSDYNGAGRVASLPAFTAASFTSSSLARI
eukprot:tig00000215_g18627.t1